MSKMSNVALALAEERRWRKHFTEQDERDFIAQYTKDRLPPPNQKNTHTDVTASKRAAQR